MSTEPAEEPGRFVSESGLIGYDWPPRGRFAELWRRIDAAIPDAEKGEALSLLNRWQNEHSTLVAYTDENGEWVDVEPRWSEIDGWLTEE